MKYRTTIHITTEAKDKNEAMELAGEYISGNISNGVKMRFRTVPARQHYIVAAVVTCAFIGMFYVSAVSVAVPGHAVSPSGPCGYSSAVQPPLQTSMPHAVPSYFKNDWKAKEQQAAIRAITK